MKSWIASMAAAGFLAAAAMSQPVYPVYSISDLGVVGGTPGQPYIITDNGLIGGAAGAANNQMHAAVWFMGFKADLGTPLGGPNSAAYAINAQGQVTGVAETATSNSEDFCGFNAYGLAKSTSACLPFTWQNGVMTKLPTLGGANAIAMKINNLGEVAGYSETGSRDPNGACPVSQVLPVVWTKNGATGLKTAPGDTSGVAWAINDRGQVAGASGTCASFNPDSGLYMVPKHALLWQNGAVVDLGNLGGTGNLSGNHACALNNLGQVVGHSDLTGDSTFHGFLWSWETGMRDIGTLVGDVASLALGINDRGVTVGASLDKDFNPRAIVFESGDMTDLNAAVSSNPQKLYLLLAESINDHGQIVGLAVDGNGSLHGFLATPDPAATQSARLANSIAPAPLSDDARKTVFRRLGVARR